MRFSQVFAAAVLLAWGEYQTLFASPNHDQTFLRVVRTGAFLALMTGILFAKEDKR